MKRKTGKTGTPIAEAPPQAERENCQMCCRKHRNADRYCSDACRARAARPEVVVDDEDQQPATLERVKGSGICAFCGVVVDGKLRVYCSRACGRSHYAARNAPATGKAARS